MEVRGLLGGIASPLPSGTRGSNSGYPPGVAAGTCTPTPLVSSFHDPRPSEAGSHYIAPAGLKLTGQPASARFLLVLTTPAL